VAGEAAGLALPSESDHPSLSLRRWQLRGGQKANQGPGKGAKATMEGKTRHPYRALLNWTKVPANAEQPSEVLSLPCLPRTNSSAVRETEKQLTSFFCLRNFLLTKFNVGFPRPWDMNLSAVSATPVPVLCSPAWGAAEHRRWPRGRPAVRRSCAKIYLQHLLC